MTEILEWLEWAWEVQHVRHLRWVAEQAGDRGAYERAAKKLGELEAARW
jgi:hypothetical protein